MTCPPRRRHLRHPLCQGRSYVRMMRTIRSWHQRQMCRRDVACFDLIRPCNTSTLSNTAVIYELPCLLTHPPTYSRMISLSVAIATIHYQHPSSLCATVCMHTSLCFSLSLSFVCSSSPRFFFVFPLSLSLCLSLSLSLPPFYLMSLGVSIRWGFPGWWVSTLLCVEKDCRILKRPPKDCLDRRTVPQRD